MRSYIVFPFLVGIFFIGLVMSEDALANNHNDYEHHHNSSFSLFSLVRPLGIATLSFVSTTFLTGLFRKKLRRRFLKIHLFLAIVSVALGFAHGVLVFILYS